jgi:hypothetical protein
VLGERGAQSDERASKRARGTPLRSTSGTIAASTISMIPAFCRATVFGMDLGHARRIELAARLGEVRGQLLHPRDDRLEPCGNGAKSRATRLYSALDAVVL